MEIIIYIWPKYLSSESYEGNLLDILNWPDAKTVTFDGKPAGLQAGGPQVGAPPEGMPAIRFAEGMDTSFFPKYARTMCFPNIYTDNRKLDGFMEHFIKNNNCENSICAGTIIEDGKKCSFACDHCGAWAKKAVSYDGAEVDQWLSCASDVLDTLECGGMRR